MKKYYIAIFLLVITLLPEKNYAQVREGEIAPDFEYLDIQNNPIKLSDYNGKVVFLAFIGYGCPFCRAEAWSTEVDVWRKYKDTQFQALALDTWNGSISQVQSYINSTGITYPVLTKAGDASDLYGITYDNYLVIDHQGVLRYTSADNGGLGERFRLSEVISEIDYYLSRIGLNNSQIPIKFKLSQNYPNPFHGITPINYTVRTRKHVNLSVYDISGRIVDTLVDDVRSPSDYEVDWNPKGLSSGVYIYRLVSGRTNISRKMLYIK